MLCRRNGFDVFIEAVRHALEVQQLLQRRSRQCNMQRSACNMQRSACNIQIAPCSQQAVRTSQHRQAGTCSGLLASCVLASRPRRVRFTTRLCAPPSHSAAHSGVIGAPSPGPRPSRLVAQRHVSLRADRTCNSRPGLARSRLVGYSIQARRPRRTWFAFLFVRPPPCAHMGHPEYSHGWAEDAAHD
jgi:hypothetical protein